MSMSMSMSISMLTVGFGFGSMAVSVTVMMGKRETLLKEGADPFHLSLCAIGESII